MARRGTTTRRPTEPVDAIDLQAKENLIKKVLGTAGIGALAFDTKSMFSTAVKYADGKFKMKPIDQGDEFTLSGMRIGAKSQFIFEFKPVDSAEYVQMELDEAKVFGVFPGLEKMVIEALGLIAAPKIAGNRPYERAYTWPTGKDHWLKQERGRLRDAGETRASEREKELVAEAEEKATEQKKAFDAYAENPEYGSW